MQILEETKHPSITLDSLNEKIANSQHSSQILGLLICVKIVKPQQFNVSMKKKSKTISEDFEKYLDQIICQVAKVEG